MVNDGLNYTIVSDNTYIGAWTSSASLSWSLGFSCVHNTQASNVICAEETSNNGKLGYVTQQMVYGATAGDFLTASVVGGRNLLAATATPARASGATATPTANLASPQSTGAAVRRDGSIAIAVAGAVLVTMW